jgi:phosphoglycerate dehydrogenase-like enzyme
MCVHLPLNDTTRNYIGAKQLRSMKPGAILINLARGGIVDEDALREALLDGHIRGAALDVHANEGEGNISPLADLTNVILTPHIGATTIDTQQIIGERIVEAVELYLRGAGVSES